MRGEKEEKGGRDEEDSEGHKSRLGRRTRDVFATGRMNLSWDRIGNLAQFVAGFDLMEINEVLGKM